MLLAYGFCASTCGGHGLHAGFFCCTRYVKAKSPCMPCGYVFETCVWNMYTLGAGAGADIVPVCPNHCRPNGRTCVHGEFIDDVEFDNQFRCSCSGTVYTGPNCEDAVDDAVADDNAAAIVGGTLSFVIVLICIALIVMYQRALTYRMRSTDFEKKMLDWIKCGAITEDAHSLGGENMPREIKRAHVMLIKSIGSGAFGEVFVGKLDESSLVRGVPSYLVAIKTVKAGASEEGIDDLLKEVQCSINVLCTVDMYTVLNIALETCITY